jgi:hypothetical protein
VLDQVVRGGPVRRTCDVRVRLTPDEYAAWSAARAVTGRRELGAWLRITVNEMLSLPSGERLDRPEPVPPVVDAQTYLTLVTAANALAGLAARANAEARYPAEREISHCVSVMSEGYRRDRSIPVHRSAPHRPSDTPCDTHLKRALR